MESEVISKIIDSRDPNNTIVCMICIDNPSKENPIYLLSCGCKQSWFHESCKNLWISKTEHPLCCPICKRKIQMKWNYCFSYFAGPYQKQLWHCAICFFFEFLYAIYYNFYSLPIFTISTLSMPFMISSPRTLRFFVNTVQLKYFIHSFYFIYVLLLEKNILNINLNFLFYSSIIQYLVVCINQMNDKRPSVDPLIPYAISCDVIYVSLLTP
jgi:hypothetical protein